MRPDHFQSWTKEAEVSSAGLEVPTFSVPPLGYISQIGEHLFTLPQQLEPYASVGAQSAASRPKSPFLAADEDCSDTTEEGE